MSKKERQDISDMRRCVSVGGWLERCSGGRLVISGYVCPHCDSDDPKTECKSPAKSD